MRLRSVRQTAQRCLRNLLLAPGSVVASASAAACASMHRVRPRSLRWVTARQHIGDYDLATSSTSSRASTSPMPWDRRNDRHLVHEPHVSTARDIADHPMRTGSAQSIGTPIMATSVSLPRSLDFTTALFGKSLGEDHATEPVKRVQKFRLRLAQQHCQ